MKTKYHTPSGKRLLFGSIFIQLFCNSRFKNLLNKTYTVASLNYGWSMVFGNQGADNVNNLILISPHNTSETKRYFLKKPLCL